MKKISFFTVFVLTVAAAVCACTKENDPSGEVNPREKVISVLHASLEQFGQGTKTYFSTDTAGYGGYPVLWEEGDLLVVANQYATSIDSCGIFRLTDGAGSMHGEFEFESGGTVSDNPFYAFYPSSYVSAVVRTTWYVSFPSTQQYVPGRAFAQDAFPEYASADSLSGTLNFKSMMSILKLRLHSSQGHLIRSITVTTADSGKYLSGEFRVNMKKGVISGGGLCKSVCMMCDPPMSIDVDTTFYVVLPPADYNNLTVCIKSEKDGVPCIMNRTIPTRYSTLSANKIRAMATLEVTGGGYNPPHYKEASYGLSDSTDYGPGILFAGLDVYWAPVNCGIGGTKPKYPKGLLYQWGRKYGQVLENVQEDTLQTFADGQDPGKREYFAANYVNDNDKPTERWWRNKYDPRDYVWGETDTTSNPCPEGWRVPTVGEFAALVSYVPQTPRDTDILFKVGSDSLSLPRAGLHDQGGAYKMQAEALLWTSTISGYTINAKAHVFTTGGSGNPNAELRNEQQVVRAGLSVRCVHDQ